MVRAQLLLALTCVLCLSRINRALDFQYHDYSRMTLFLQNMAQQYPQKAFLFEIGKSGQGEETKSFSTSGTHDCLTLSPGRSLWALALSAYAPGAHILTRPEVKYIANMHGNEVVGLEMLLYLIEYLLTSPDLQVYQLMQRSRIWIMPSMNPDGLEISQYGDCTSTNGRSGVHWPSREERAWCYSRYVLNNIDLNRNFPDYLNQSLSEPIRAAETNAIMSWIDQVPFVLSANYHGGAFIINIPFDRFCKSQSKTKISFQKKEKPLFFLDVGQVSISADDDVYQILARTYVNRISETRRYCEFGQDDIGTVTRGADWYEVVGGMQDYGYLNYGTIEMTMEISCCKYPQSNQLVHYWNYNRDAMIELLFQAQRGSGKRRW